LVLGAGAGWDGYYKMRGHEKIVISAVGFMNRENIEYLPVPPSFSRFTSVPKPFILFIQPCS